MRKFFFILSSLIICSATLVNAQGLYDANWYFGLKFGLNFTSGTPVEINSSEMPSVEGCASISDSLGNILFYTNGVRVFDSNNQVMPHGDSLITNPIFWQFNFEFGSSSTNGIIIIPRPLHSTQYYIFSEWSASTIGYSVVDMNLNGGLGDVVPSEKNVAIQSGLFTEKLAAVRHGNGRDWWLIAHESGNKKFDKWIVTPDSITEFSQQAIGKTHLNEFGEMCFSQQGDKLGIVNICGVAEVFSFNRCNGNLSLLCEQSADNPNCDIDTFSNYGCSFSPDGNIFYYSNFNKFYQCNLGGDCTAQLIAMRPLDSLVDANGLYQIGAHQLAPDGKIYFVYYKFGSANDSANHFIELFTIDSPNVVGTGCHISHFNGNFGGHYIAGNSGQYTLGLPNEPNYNLGRKVGSLCDTLFNSVNEIENEKAIVRIYPNPAQQEITIEILNGVKPKLISVTDATGREIIKINSSKPNTQINISSLSAGLYFIKVQQSSGEIEVKKFVKL